jgi:hypothetical protein
VRIDIQKVSMSTYRHALQPFFERAGRGVVVGSTAAAGVAGSCCSWGVGCDIPRSLSVHSKKKQDENVDVKSQSRINEKS